MKHAYQRTYSSRYSGQVDDALTCAACLRGARSVCQAASGGWHSSLGRSELRGPSPRPSSWVISRPVQRVRPRVEVVGLPRRPSCLKLGSGRCVVSVVACVWLVWTLCRAEIARDRRRVCYRQPTFQVSIAKSVVISRDLVLTVSCPKPGLRGVGRVGFGNLTSACCLSTCSLGSSSMSESGQPPFC